MAPQVIQKIKYSRKCDVWSLGVILYELLFSCRPWYGRSEEELLHNILSLPLRFPKGVSRPTKRLIEEMLAFGEDSRVGWE
jgi:serine/threonine protein kinase